MGIDICIDNRFEIIATYKKKLIEGTNIKASPEEMAVIDNILFRFWQMGWLPPIPHGRLIDADELQRKFERMANEEWNKNIAVSAASCFDDAAVVVEDAPTIIEAEE